MTEQRDIMDSLMRLMRNLRRHPPGKPHRSRGYMRLLRILSKDEGQTAGELADIMDIRPSSLTELLDKMEDDGAIARIRDENDLRIIRISLLDKGRQALAEFNDFRKKEGEKLAACLTEQEQQTLCDICDKLVACLGPDAEPRCK